MKRVIPLILAVSVSGCASADEYIKYADTQLLIKQEDTKAEIARAQAEAARYNAISAIAVAGNDTAKAVGMMALQNTSSASSRQTGQTVLVQPRSFSDTALQWTSILLNPVVSIYGIVSNRHVAETQSNNARDTTISGYNTMLGIASQNKAPNLTIGGNGVIGNGQYTTTDFSGTGVIGTGSYTTNALGGAGVIGSGSYSTPIDDHTISNSYNPPTNSNNPLTCTTGPC
jgi:hypothetical protein